MSINVDYSRAQSCGLGKCNTDIKTSVPEEVKEQLTALAVLNGQTLSEYCRDLFITHVYGHVTAIRLQRRIANGSPD